MTGAKPQYEGSPVGLPSQGWHCGALHAAPDTWMDTSAGSLFVSWRRGCVERRQQQRVLSTVQGVVEGACPQGCRSGQEGQDTPAARDGGHQRGGQAVRIAAKVEPRRVGHTPAAREGSHQKGSQAVRIAAKVEPPREGHTLAAREGRHQRGGRAVRIAAKVEPPRERHAPAARDGSHQGHKAQAGLPTHGERPRPAYMESTVVSASDTGERTRRTRRARVHDKQGHLCLHLQAISSPRPSPILLTTSTTYSCPIPPMHAHTCLAYLSHSHPLHAYTVPV